MTSRVADCTGCDETSALYYAAMAERDAARAEVERLRAALQVCATRCAWCESAACACCGSTLETARAALEGK